MVRLSLPYRRLYRGVKSATRVARPGYQPTSSLNQGGAGESGLVGDPDLLMPLPNWVCPSAGATSDGEARLTLSDGEGSRPPTAC